MTNHIVSTQNPRVKQWAQLLNRRGRQKFGQYIIEGVHLVEEAVKVNAAVTVIVYQLNRPLPEPLYERMRDRVEWVGVSPEIMAKCTDTETPQGLFAIIDMPTTRDQHFMDIICDLAVVVDGVQDPGNLGTIIRSADAVGAGGILLGKGSVDLYNPKTIRSTMGSMFHLPIIECDLTDVLPDAKERGIQIIGTSLQANCSCYEIDFRHPTWIIVGNEGQGVSPEVSALVSQNVIIPMQGQAESLNVAMAATVLLFEASRQRLL